MKKEPIYILLNMNTIDTTKEKDGYNVDYGIGGRIVGLEILDYEMIQFNGVPLDQLISSAVKAERERCAKKNKKFAWWLSVNYSRFHDSWYMSNNNGKHDNPLETKQPFISWEEVLEIYKNQKP